MKDKLINALIGAVALAIFLFLAIAPWFMDSK